MAVKVDRCKEKTEDTEKKLECAMGAFISLVAVKVDCCRKKIEETRRKEEEENLIVPYLEC